MRWLLYSPLVPAAVALASALLLAWGRRGRKVNDHPICRKCGFDLFGLPPGAATCSECGADLRRRRAILPGATRPHRKAVATAVLLLVPAVACLGYHGWSAATDVPFVQRKPVWWLLNDASASDPVARDEAFTELTLRFRGGRLSDTRLEQVVDRALALQADRRRTWLPRWGDFVEEAYRAGRVPADTWRTYVRNAPEFELVATERFKRGDRAWLELIERPSRVGSKQDLVLRVHRRLTVVDERGGRFTRDFGSVQYGVGGQSLLKGGWSLPLNDGVIGRLADGRHEATLELVVEVFPLRDAPLRPQDRGRPPVATETLQLHAAWNVERAIAGESDVAVNRK